MLYTLFPLLCDVAEPWALGIQDPASPSAEGVIELHDTIMFYIIAIIAFVFWMLGTIVLNYRASSNGTLIAHKYSNHGTLLELVWTITPAFVLVAIAFPSFKLLYLLDNISTLTLLFESAYQLLSGYQIRMASFHVKTRRLEVSDSSKALVLTTHENLGSTLGIRFRRIWLSITSFHPNTISQLVGHLLGDGCLLLTHTSTVPYFTFTQTIKRFDYIWAVYMTLKHYCTKLPGVNHGDNWIGLVLITRSYSIFKTLHSLFYKFENGKYVKYISYELLPYLDDIVLAYWAIDDGGATSSRVGFYLHTEGFTFPDVYRLAAIMHYRFGIVCTVQKKKNKPVLYITAKSMPLFRSLVTPHFHPSIIYKLTTTKKK